jgi:alpha-L-fucosidase
VGNESGEAGVTCWATLNKSDFAPGQADQARLKSGDRPGTDWVPAECDVSIRPGWFYHAKEDSRVKSTDKLLDLYFKSVGRGASLLLNVPPDRRGRVHENDARALREFRQRLDDLFAHDLARDAGAAIANTRGDDARFAARNAVDGHRDTYWATDDSATNAELVLEFKEPVKFNVVRLREYLPLGQRVEAFAIDQWADGQWVECGAGTSIGNCRLVRVAPATSSKVRLRIVKASVCPAIAEWGLFWDNPTP